MAVAAREPTGLIDAIKKAVAMEEVWNRRNRSQGNVHRAGRQEEAKKANIDTVLVMQRQPQVPHDRTRND